MARLIHRSGLRGATEAAAVSSAAEAGLRGEASPVTGVLASRVRHGLRYLQQKTGEVALMLTKGLDGEGCSAGRLAARSGGGPWRSARMGRRGASPGSWAPQFGSRGAYEEATMIRVVRGAPTVWNCHGGATHRRRVAG